MCILFYWLQWQANANYSYLKMSTHIMCSHCFFVFFKTRPVSSSRTD
jgi:hypothetical protein